MITNPNQSASLCLKSPAFLTTIIILALGVAALLAKSEPVLSGLFFVPFALGPLFVSIFLSIISPSKSCQITLSIGSILYALWFGYIYLDAFYWHLDPQSAIALVFIGIYSLPVMILVWIITLVLRKKHNSKMNGV